MSDILPCTKSGSRLLNSLELLLNLLTNKLSIIRNGSYLLILLLNTFTLLSILRIRNYSNNKIHNLEIYTEPDQISTQSAHQLSEYIRIDELIESSVSAYDPLSFIESSTEISSKGVTAILLNWKRTKGLQLIVKQLSRYPFIREIIIFNNNQFVQLYQQDFNLTSPIFSILSPPILRIYNSPNNLHDAAKHFSCSIAKYSHCYFNDDDWLNLHLDSQFSHYLENPTRIVSNTLPIIHLEHQRWRFQNLDIDLHTGFTWLGTGSFSPKSFSTRFLNQQTVAPIGLTREETLVSDMFFSIWTNSYPEQLVNNLEPIDVEGGEVGWSRGTGIDQWAIVYANILSAIRKLNFILKISDLSLVPDPFTIEIIQPESFVRAPCVGDDCLFFTTLSPFPHPSKINHPTSTKTITTTSILSKLFGSKIIATGKKERVDGRFNPEEIHHIKELEERYNSFELGWPKNDWWIEKGSWHLAVDKNLKTCWESFSKPEMDSFFGLILVNPIAIKKITIIGSKDLGNILEWSDLNEQGWELTTLGVDDSGWKSRRLSIPPQLIQLEESKIKVVLTLKSLFDSYGILEEIKKIKFISKGKKLNKLIICGFEIDDLII